MGVVKHVISPFNGMQGAEGGREGWQAVVQIAATQTR